MRFKLFAGFLIITLLSPTLARAKDAKPDPSISKIGNWSIHLSIDPMTDSKSCTGLYNGKFDVQLNEGHLYISLRGRGGVSGIVLRFDDEPARPLRLPTEMEKRIDIVDIEGEDFQKLLDSKRLRVQVLTVLNSLVDEDISLVNLKEALTVISGPKCSNDVKPQ